MPARAELTLAALGLIHHCSADSLSDLAQARGITPDESWNVYALATALIEPGAVWHQLSRLDRNSLVQIDQLRQHPGTSCPSLPWGIEDTELGRVRPEVIHAIETFSSEWNTALTRPDKPDSATTARNTGTPAGALSQSLPRIVDMLDELGLAISLVASHDISHKSPSNLSLSKALGQLAPDVSADWGEAADWGVWSGLLVHQSGSWWVSDEAPKFVASDRATQLGTLVTRWWESAEEALRTELQRLAAKNLVPASVVDHAVAHFPLLDSSTVSAFFERGHTLGAFSANQATTLVGHLVAGDDVKRVLEPLMPPPAPGVYLDGADSVVGAGPLTPEHRESLSLVARCIRGGMTPRWVVNPENVVTSLRDASAEELCDRLASVIIGGVPDSLRHQFLSLESRVRSLSLSPDFPATLLHCADHYLSQLLLVDQKLQTLHLTRIDDTTLSSARDIRQTRQILLDAGYPTFPTGITPGSPRVLKAQGGTPVPASWWSDIIAGAKDMPKNAVWTEDVLHDAIAGRTLLSLSVRVGDTERHMVVEPRSIAGGRLRVKDTAADVERTLPIDTIVSIHPAQPSVA